MDGPNDDIDSVPSSSKTVDHSEKEKVDVLKEDSEVSLKKMEPSVDDTNEENPSNGDSEISPESKIEVSDEEGGGPKEPESVDITPEKSGGVLKKILKEGEGDEYPGYGDKVSVHYTGWRLGKEPVEFDSSRKGDKFEFNLGRGMVIKGWDLGISTMKKGEIAVFIVHPRYAYGDMGYPPAIPPFTPLVFEIELFGWKMEDLSPKKDDSILRKVLEKGEGSTFPNEGSQVKVKLIRYINDKPVETERDFILGEGCIADIPEGIELALSKFHLKEKSLIYLKHKYTEEVKEKSEENTTSDEEVKYEITLISFEKAKDIWEMNSDEKFEKAKVSKEKGVDFYKMGHYKVALKQFKWIVTCLENEPGASPDTQKDRKSLLLSGYLNIALCHQKLENYSDVIKACDKALTLDPNNEKALFRRGQAKVQINDCEEALSDFKNLCSLNPDNKAAYNYVVVCQNKIKQQQLKDKSTYNKMFELFVKQDEERLKNMKTETGVWESEEGDGSTKEPLSDNQSLLNNSNAALLDANVIEISNTANGNISYNM